MAPGSAFLATRKSWSHRNNFKLFAHLVWLQMENLSIALGLDDFGVFRGVPFHLGGHLSGDMYIYTLSFQTRGKLRVHEKNRCFRGKPEVLENHGFPGAVNVPQFEKFLHVMFCLQVGLQTLCTTIATIKEHIYVDFWLNLRQICNQCCG